MLFTCKNRRRYSRERASQSLEVIQFMYSFSSSLSTATTKASSPALSNRLFPILLPGREPPECSIDEREKGPKKLRRDTQAHWQVNRTQSLFRRRAATGPMSKASFLMFTKDALTRFQISASQTSMLPLAVMLATKESALFNLGSLYFL